jgi:(p)ppGpp synthase/HD superfamily hydrolase
MTTDIAPQLELSGMELESAAEMLAREAHGRLNQMYDDLPIAPGAELRTYADGHLVPVVNFMRACGFGSRAIAGGWLHDTPEDTDVTLEDMLERGIPAGVTHSVDLVTKKKGIDYNDPEELKKYLRAIAEDEDATMIKFADSSINYANCVLLQPIVRPDRLVKRVRRYRTTISFLGPLVEGVNIEAAQKLWDQGTYHPQQREILGA